MMTPSDAVTRHSVWFIGESAGVGFGPGTGDVGGVRAGGMAGAWTGVLAGFGTGFGSGIDSGGLAAAVGLLYLVVVVAGVGTTAAEVLIATALAESVLVAADGTTLRIAAADGSATG